MHVCVGVCVCGCVCELKCVPHLLSTCAVWDSKIFIYSYGRSKNVFGFEIILNSSSIFLRPFISSPLLSSCVAKREWHFVHLFSLLVHCSCNLPVSVMLVPSPLFMLLCCCGDPFFMLLDCLLSSVFVLFAVFEEWVKKKIGQLILHGSTVISPP